MLFPPSPTDNVLPFDGVVNDFGVVLEQPKLLYQKLLHELPWQPDQVTVFGKTHVTKRQVVWMGEEKVSYRYSGHRRIAINWSPDVLSIKQLIEKKLAQLGVNIHFNACLLNYYPTGDEGMSYHADDEPELGVHPVVASLSLGATRQFVLKHNVKPSRVALSLESGQLVVMRGKTQQFWQHSITKTTTVAAGRISLTFRKIFPAY